MSITVTTDTPSDIDISSVRCGGNITGTLEGDYLPIVDRILKNKFQLYNRTRQKIVADVKAYQHFRPFALFEDEKQSDSGNFKTFIMGSFTWKPISEVLTVELIEYDNTTDVNLVDL